ncbi:DUF551 domain-containing protein [Serratia marcescens]|uniref:DUF551 domain-containing protein n=1 Tax=Serratia marcescens TaxID=615 RepID=UPI001F062B9F|nr:DUF551 domain-containing protein [Serratia marcescens]MDM1788455.1 DUF551 domain-containing protein [Serratia marcescens]MDM1794931.1 DUF551 domain-containing protein [Serratia marcescens]MDM1802635.1 DUF551 domain-containing protein [Serratia marcescens]MDM1804766.1 DUF551 domain-containing protein [Serratia marcescens]MDM1811799.1 DUF551 domain-containing protein [Serratia marcescens]
MTPTTERQQFAEQNEMSMDFVNWFFDEKKDGCGNAWFIMAAAMWEVWKARANREAQPAGFYTTVSGRKGVVWHKGAPEDDTAIYTVPIAGREAQPVQVTDGMALDFHRALTDSDIGKDDLEEIKVGLRAALCNVTAPPAPAVPDALANDIDSDDHPLLWSYNNGWNACRAAMLAQPVSSGYTLPDGWIACSERMPDADGAYWCWFGKEKSSVIQQRVCIWNDRNHEWCDSAVTHWMPLPAAQEGGNDYDTRR